MKFSVACTRALSVVAAAVLLASCGGGDADTASTATSTTAPSQQQAAAQTELHGVVVDGYVQGAKVYLDLNNNQRFDAGEPAAESTAADGSFTLRIAPMSAAQLASALLIAEVPATAKDADDGGLTIAQAGRAAYTLMSPAASFVAADGAGMMPAVVSPLTSLVAAEVAFNGMTPAEAVESVQAQLSLTGKDLLADYVANRDDVLHAVAQTAAVATGEAQGVAKGESGSTASEQLQQSNERVKQRLPQLAQDLGAATGRRASVADTRRLWAAGESGRARAQSPAPEGYTRMIVKLDDGVNDPEPVAQALAGAFNGQVRHVYRRALKGFAIDVPQAQEGAFIDGAQNDPRVDSVENDQIVSGTQITEGNATWGLDRIDQRALPLTGTYNYGYNGTGVHVYMIDSGIRKTHTEFTGRLENGYSTIADGRGTDDCNGHGTHTSGTVGGTTWGVAKAVTIVPVRVLGCDNTGSISGIIAGVDWVATNAKKPAVANMSIGASASSTLDAAVERAVSAGVTMMVAAGNSGANACNYSPARTPGAITVGATNKSDARPSWSNWGSCLDVFGPGQDITSAGTASDTASVMMWGTSMATPHVTGMAALLLQQNPAMTPAQVTSAIKTAATTSKLTSIGTGSPNLMLFAGGLGDPTTTTTTSSGSSTTTTSVTTRYVAIYSMTGSSAASGRGWVAKVTVAVMDASNQMVPGAFVKGNFSVGGTGRSCTTGSNGTCTITSGKIGTSRNSTTFTPTALTGSGLTYLSSYNVLTSVAVAKP